MDDDLFGGLYILRAQVFATNSVADRKQICKLPSGGPQSIYKDDVPWCRYEGLGSKDFQKAIGKALEYVRSDEWDKSLWDCIPKGIRERDDLMDWDDVSPPSSSQMFLPYCPWLPGQGSKRPPAFSHKSF